MIETRPILIENNAGARSAGTLRVRSQEGAFTEFVVTPEGRIHERLEDDEVSGPLLIFGLEGEMFFGATAALSTHFATIEESIGPDTTVVVLRLKRARNPDAVGITLLEGFLERVRARGVEVLLCGVTHDFAGRLEASGLADRLGRNLFREQPVRQTSTALAIRRAYELLPGPCATCPHREYFGGAAGAGA